MAEVAERDIIVTQSAAKIISSLINEESDASLNLRIFIQGGGCSGFEYGFMFDKNINDDDIMIEKAVDDEDEGGEGGSVCVLIDPLSFQYLKGSEIDYQEDLQGARFVIRNPNAKTTCGCGSSFGV